MSPAVFANRPAGRVVISLPERALKDGGISKNLRNLNRYFINILLLETFGKRNWFYVEMFKKKALQKRVCQFSSTKCLQTNVPPVCRSECTTMGATQCSSPPSEIVLDPIGELSTRFHGKIYGKSTEVSVKSCDNGSYAKLFHVLWRQKLSSFRGHVWQDALRSTFKQWLVGPFARLGWRISRGCSC